MDPRTEKRALNNLAAAWTEQIPDEQWELYRNVIDEVSARGVPFLLGGAFGMATYTGRWRNTKDLDFFVRPSDRHAMVEILAQLGFQDYFDQLPYERHWIYRGICGDIIVDTIWEMANRRTRVDDTWFEEAPCLHVRGRDLPVLAPEEFVWSKIYVMQRDRCDWPDLYNVFYTVGPSLYWDRLLDRLGEDVPLLRGALSVFSWLCPARASDLPSWLWERLQMPQPLPEAAVTGNHRRVDLLDTRNWFGPCMPPDEPLAGGPQPLP